MKKIATLGSITIDLFVQPEKTKIISTVCEHGKEEFLALPHGGKICAEHIQTHLGGGATNTAVSFQNLELKSFVFGGIGDDENADIITTKLEIKNIETQYIQKIEHTKSGFSLILNSFDGERTVIYTSEANKKFSNISCTQLEKENFDAIHLCHTSADESEKIFTELENFFQNNPEKIFSWNPGKEIIEKGIGGNLDLLKYTNFLYLNNEEAEEFTSLKARVKISHGEERRNMISSVCPKDVSHIAQKFLDAGVQVITITDGQRGAQVFSKDKSFFVPCVSGSRIDTLGAGDAFASTLTAMVLHGNPLSKSAQYASIMAANVVAHRGAQDGILSLEALTKISTDSVQIVQF